MADRTPLRRLGLGLLIAYGAACAAGSLVYLMILQTFPETGATLYLTLTFVAAGPAAVLPCALAAVRWPRSAGRAALACGLISAVSGCAVLFAPRTPNPDEPNRWRNGADESLYVVGPFSLPLLTLGLLTRGRGPRGAASVPAAAEANAARPGARSRARSRSARTFGVVLFALWLWLAWRYARIAAYHLHPPPLPTPTDRRGAREPPPIGSRAGPSGPISNSR